MLERLQKILSARGIASRRKAEEYIIAGLVKVNGKIAILGQKADPERDKVEVDGKVLQARQEMLYYLMNKPGGVVTTNVDSFTRLLVYSRGGKANSNRRQNEIHSNQRINESTKSHTPTTRELLPANLRGKLFPVGRLDKDSEGLLLLTNDGVLAYRLTHPKFDHEKEYAVTVERPIMEGALDKMRQGMTILGEKTKPATVSKTGEKTFTIALTEGKNRQIRRMCQKIGNPVIALKRVRIMTLKDAQLRSGQIRQLTATEKSLLLNALGIDK